MISGDDLRFTNINFGVQIQRRNFIMKQYILFVAFMAVVCGPPFVLGQDEETKPPLGFFVTSTVHSGDLVVLPVLMQSASVWPLT